MFKPNLEPDIPAAISHLSSLGTDELKELLNDDDKFEEMIKDNKQLSDLESEKEVLMVRNRSLAEFNLEKQPGLAEGKQEIQSLSEEGNRLCTLVQDKLEQIREKSGTMNADTALDLLQAAAAEIEEESEKIAEKFLSGDTEVDEFLEQFLSRRKIMHMRKVKVEKMKELMRRPSAHSAPYPGYPASGHFGAMPPPYPPYSTGVITMPMPVPPVLKPF